MRRLAVIPAPLAVRGRVPSQPCGNAASGAEPRLLAISCPRRAEDACSLFGSVFGFRNDLGGWTWGELC